MGSEIYNQNILKNIQKLTGKYNVLISNRCNDAIISSIKYLCDDENSIRPSVLLIQEEGGWLLYPKLAKKFNLELVHLKINEGKIDLKELNKQKNAILILHSMPGYSYKEDMESIAEICKKNKIFLINDCCGTIGSSDAKFGDIIVCSFKKDKPLCIGRGGFLATDISINEISKYIDLTLKNSVNYINSAQEQVDICDMNKSFIGLSEKLDKIKVLSQRVKYDLKEFDILNTGNQGINVLIKYKNHDEKERLINYCKDNNLEYTLCPRYIRTNEIALSIELKRLIINK